MLVLSCESYSRTRNKYIKYRNNQKLEPINYFENLKQTNIDGIKQKESFFYFRYNSMAQNFLYQNEKMSDL